MREDFYTRVYSVLKDNFPNHKDSDYEMIATYLCSLLIIERDKQIKDVMSRVRRR